MAFAKGDRVAWNWGDGTGEGEITEIFRERVTRTIKVSGTARDANDENPAHMIEQDAGDRVLKSMSELGKAD